MAAAMGMRTGMGMGMRMGMGGAMSMGTGMGGAMAMRGRAVRAGRRAVVAALALVVSYQLLHIFAVLDSYSERYADGDTQEATASIGKDAQGTAAAIIGSTANVPLPRLGGARNAKRMQELDTVEPRVAALVLAESTSAATTSLNLNLAVQWLEYMKFAGVAHVYIYVNMQVPFSPLWTDPRQLALYFNSDYVTLGGVTFDGDISRWQDRVIREYLQEHAGKDHWLVICRMDQYPIVGNAEGSLKNYMLNHLSEGEEVAVPGTSCIGFHDSVVPPNLLLDNRHCSAMVPSTSDPVMMWQPSHCKNKWFFQRNCKSPREAKNGPILGSGPLQVLDYSVLLKSDAESRVHPLNPFNIGDCCKLLANFLRPLVADALKRGDANPMAAELESLREAVARLKTSTKYLTRLRDQIANLGPSNLSGLLLPYVEPQGLDQTSQDGLEIDATNGQGLMHQVTQQKEKYFLSAVLLNRVFLNDLFNVSTWEIWQFLEYQRYMGVEHVYWYDTAHTADENQEDALKPYIDAGFLTYHRFYDMYETIQDIHFEQDNSYIHYFETYRRETRWVMICDIDELFFMPEDREPNFLPRFLMKEYEPKVGTPTEISMIVVYCMTFLGAPQKEWPALMIERYQRRNPVVERKGSRSKLILLASAWSSIVKNTPHAMVMRSGSDYPDPNVIRFNHYWGGRLTNFGPETYADVQNLVFDDSMKPIAAALWEKLGPALFWVPALHANRQKELLTSLAEEIERSLHSLANPTIKSRR